MAARGLRYARYELRRLLPGEGGVLEASGDVLQDSLAWLGPSTSTGTTGGGNSRGGGASMNGSEATGDLEKDRYTAG